MVNTVRVIAAVLVTLSLSVVGSVPAFADKHDDEGKGHEDEQPRLELAALHRDSIRDGRAHSSLPVCSRR